MRIALIDTHACGAGEMAARWWRTVSHDELRVVPLSDGGPSLARALAANPPDGDDLWLAGAQWCTAPGADLRRASSRELGQALISALEIAEPGARIFLGLPGEADFHDGGAGALAELMGWVSARGADSFANLLGGGAMLHQVTRADLPARTIGEVIRRIRGVELHLVCADPTPARGLHGAGATLARSGRAGEAEAQELDAKVGAFWRQLRRAVSASQANLLTGLIDGPGSGGPGSVGGADPYERLPYSGCGGASAGLFARLGAYLDDGGQTCCRQLPLRPALQWADVAVMLTDEVAAPPSAIVRAVAQETESLAASSALPLVALAGRVSAAQHEWAQIGISEVRSVIDPYQRRSLAQVSGYRPTYGVDDPPPAASGQPGASGSERAGAEQAAGAASGAKNNAGADAAYLTVDCWVREVGEKKFANRVKALARAWGQGGIER